MRRSLVLTAALAVLLSVSGVFTAPNAIAANCSQLSDFDYVADLGLSCELGDGLLKVLVGAVPNVNQYVLTHNGDDPGIRDCCSEQLPQGNRAVDCVGGSAYRVRAIYARPSNIGYDSQIPGEIKTTIRRANAFLGSEAGSVGVPSDLRVMCSNGSISVASVQLPHSTTEDSFSSIITDLQAKGYDSTKAKYLIYYDGSFSACGRATLAWDASDGASNVNNVGPDYAASFRCLDSDTGYNGWGAAIFLHELFHTLGAVQKAAPHSTNNWAHCTDERDVMCYDDGAAGGVTIVCNNVQLDCGMNDYWAPTKTSSNGNGWIGNHWNIGSCYVRFIERGCEPNTNPPTAPTNLTVFSQAGSFTNRLEWTGSAGATRYNIYRWSGAFLTDVTEKRQIASTTGTTYNDSAPLTLLGQQVCYDVTAENANGESGHSNEVCLLHF